MRKSSKIVDAVRRKSIFSPAIKTTSKQYSDLELNYDVDINVEELISGVILKFPKLNRKQRQNLIISLIKLCDPTDMLFLNKKIPKLHRDFIQLLPKNIAFRVLDFIQPMDFCRIVCVSQFWKNTLADITLWERLYTKLGLLSMSDTYYIPTAPMLVNARRLDTLGNWAKGEFTYRRIKLHPLAILCISHNSRFIATGSADRSCKVFDIKNGQCVRTLIGHDQKIFSIAMHSDMIITGSSDKSIRVWSNKDEGSLIAILNGHQGSVGCLKFSGTTLISGSDDKTIRIWDISKESLSKIKIDNELGFKIDQKSNSPITRHPCVVRILHGHVAGVRSLDFHECVLISGDIYGYIRIWHIESGNCIGIIANTNGDFKFIQPDISSFGMVASATVLETTRDPITCLNYIGKNLVVSTLSGRIFLYKVEAPPIPNPNEVNTPSSFQAMRNWANKKGSFVLDNIYTLQSKGNMSNSWTLCNYCDAWRLMAAGSDGKCYLWNHQSQKLLYVLQNDTIDQGRKIFQIPHDATAVNLASEIETIVESNENSKEYNRTITGVSFDHTLVISGGMDGCIRIWESKKTGF